MIGCVFTPNSFVAAEGLTVQEALDRAGGPTEMADGDQIYLMRADGNVESLAQSKQRRLDLAARLLPGDVVLVPRQAPERTFGAELADTLALLRQTAELSLIGSQVGRPIDDFNFSSISDPARGSDGVSSYQEAILDQTRR